MRHYGALHQDAACHCRPLAARGDVESKFLALAVCELHRFRWGLSRAYYLWQQRVATVLDFSHDTPVAASASLRNAVSNVLKENVDVFFDHVVCEARVCSNSVFRVILTAFDLLAEIPWPCDNVGAGCVAELWGRSQLAREGLVAPRNEVWRPRRVDIVDSWFRLPTTWRAEARDLSEFEVVSETDLPCLGACAVRRRAGSCFTDVALRVFPD